MKNKDKNAREENVGGDGDSEQSQQVQERLQHRIDELAASNSELAQFAYVVSHDLQEPLRGIRGCLQILSKRYKEKLDAAGYDLINHAVEGADRMSTLIADILLLSRVDTKGKAFQLTDMNTVVDVVLQNLATAISESDAVVTHDPLPSVLADDTQLNQLFQNLIGNAIKFHGDNPPHVHISAVAKEFDNLLTPTGNGETDKPTASAEASQADTDTAGHDPSVRLNNQVWLISVKDNGIGIDKKFHDRVFQIFQRLHTRNSYEGNGIGLSICRKIVERHGGKIWFEDEVATGTTFSFTIPKDQNSS